MIKSIYEYLDEILPSIEQPIVFELGLSIGMDTIKLVDLCNENLQFHGFEPNPVCIEHLRIHPENRTPLGCGSGVAEQRSVRYHRGRQVVRLWKCADDV